MSLSSTPIDSVEQAGTVADSLGALVAQLRQARGLSHQDVSARLKYSIPQLEALEQEDWQRLPSGIPLRWMVQSYARYLEADEALMLSLLEAANPDACAPTRAPVQDLRKGVNWSEADKALQAEGGPRSWGWLIVITLLILVALFYALKQGWIPEQWLVFDWLKEL